MTPTPPDDQSNDLDPQEPGQEEHRREASARFEVRGAAGGQAGLREAMDPANQSLADALRLSFRVLQVAILGLLITFFFSGFQTVQEGYTGVKTIFGRIQGTPGDEQLSPGLEPFWPYPVGEIVVFEVKRQVELRNEFWPRVASRQLTLAKAIESADTATPIRPGVDGSVLTGDGDLAHLQVSAEYAVADVSQFLSQVNREKTDALVRKAIARGVVHASASMSLSDLLADRDPGRRTESGAEAPAAPASGGAPAGGGAAGATGASGAAAPSPAGTPPAAASGAADPGAAASAPPADAGALGSRSSRRAEIERLIQTRAQEMLDGLRCGIRITSLTVPERIAPLAVENSFQRVQVAREQSKEMVEKARQGARGALVAAAGPAYQQLIDGVRDYETALSAADNSRADAVLRTLGRRLEQPDIGGEASLIINRAKAYQSTVQATLGAEARRVAGLAASFRENPRQLVRQMWLDTMRQVFQQGGAEVISTPLALQSMSLRLSSSPDVMQFRRKAELDRKKNAADAAQLMRPGTGIQLQDITIDKAGRRLRAGSLGTPSSPAKGG